MLTYLKILIRSLSVAGAVILTTQVQALDTSQDNVQAFINQLVTTHGFDRKVVTSALAAAEIKESILKAMSRPAEKSKPWHEYRKIFVNNKRINRGVEFWTSHAEEINEIASRSGVPAEIIVAIIGVETHYGKITGSYRVIDALSTLAFAYPPRSEFFTKELEQFFLLCQEEKIELTEAKGSYAGAMGAPQFIPSSYRVYSADGDADGRRDLFGNWSDVFSSIAHYFLGHGWQPGGEIISSVEIDPRVSKRLELDKVYPVYRVGFLRDQGVDVPNAIDADDLSMIVNLDGKDGLESYSGYQNFYVITRYNRSKMYAMAVYQLAEELRAGVAKHASN